MRRRLSHSLTSKIQEGSKDATLKIPSMTLSHLVSMIAIAKWVVCDHDAMTNPGFRRAVQFMEQLVYEQSHQSGGADEIWKDPQDGTYHHPTFPEQQGDAWRAMVQYDEKVVETRLVEIASAVLAEREEGVGRSREDSQEYYERLMQDIVEEEGAEGLMRALIT